MKPMFTRFLFILLASFTAASTFAQYTLEQSLGAPYVQSIHASIDQQSLAWVVNEEGRRNIWYSELDGNAPQQLTNYPQDDGLNISQISISAGYLVFVRGNGNNRQGQPANPASLPTTPQRQILRLNLENKEIDTIATAAGPVLSPDGYRMVYAKSVV